MDSFKTFNKTRHEAHPMMMEAVVCTGSDPEPHHTRTLLDLDEPFDRSHGLFCRLALNGLVALLFWLPHVAPTYT